MGDFDAVVHTGEVWFGRLPTDPEPYLDLALEPGVKEYVATDYETSDAERGHIQSQIHRLGPIAILGKAADDYQMMEMGFLSPIRRAWAKRETLIKEDTT